MEILSVRIDAATKRRLETLAGSTASTKSKLAAVALSEYLERHEWQINAIVAGLHAVDEERCVAHEALRHEVLDTRAQDAAAPEREAPAAPQTVGAAVAERAAAAAPAAPDAATAAPRSEERARRLGTVFASFVRRGAG